MRFIGDIHGKLNGYKSIVKKTDTESIQVGDFGFGFIGNAYQHKRFVVDTSKHKFIRGNHDDPSVAKSQPNYIKDGSIYKNVFCVGGAWSIDQKSRVEGVSWWRDEELSYAEFGDVIQSYSIVKPEIVCTHDGPNDATNKMFCEPWGKPLFKTTTGSGLQAMFEIHQPKIWIFGHWHKDMVTKINGTTFICVGELSYVDIDLVKMKILGGSSNIFNIHKKL